MKKVFQFSIIFILTCLVSAKTYSQVSGLYEEYGPLSVASSSYYKEFFNREGVKVFAKVVQGVGENAAWIYFRIENKNSTPAFVGASFSATGLPVTGPYGVKKTGGSVPGDRVDARSYIEIRRMSENVAYVETLMVVLHSISFGSKNSSQSGN